MTYRYYLTGCDCTGKSTIANELSELTGIEITKYSVPRDTQQEGMEWEEFKHYAHSSVDCILDRAWHGRYAYDGITAAQERDMLDILLLSRAFTKNGGVILFTTTAQEIIIERMRSRGDEFIKEEDIDGILWKYEHLQTQLQENGIPFYLIDTTYLC